MNTEWLKLGKYQVVLPIIAVLQQYRIAVVCILNSVVCAQKCSANGAIEVRACAVGGSHSPPRLLNFSSFLRWRTHTHSDFRTGTRYVFHFSTASARCLARFCRPIRHLHRFIFLAGSSLPSAQPLLSHRVPTRNPSTAHHPIEQIPCEVVRTLFPVSK